MCFIFPTPRKRANLALAGDLHVPSWWGYNYIASSRLGGLLACGEFTDRKKGLVDFDLWIYGLYLPKFNLGICGLYLPKFNLWICGLNLPKSNSTAPFIFRLAKLYV